MDLIQAELALQLDGLDWRTVGHLRLFFPRFVNFVEILVFLISKTNLVKKYLTVVVTESLEDEQPILN